jgi:hypothetical protein
MTANSLSRLVAQRLAERVAPGSESVSVDWSPFPDTPQEHAYHSEADVIGFGGAAGGGKTDLILGKAFTQFKRSAIYRLNNSDLQDLIDRGDEILDGAAAFVRGEKRRWDLPGGEIIHASSVETMKDIRKYRGRPRDFMAFDEASEFLEIVVRTLMGWLRTDDPEQQTQVLLTFNPPDELGEWLIAYFAPWLDEQHANPARDGELRWFIRHKDEDVEVESGEPVEIDGQTYKPQSRTFFRARVEDNPALMETDYRDQLNMLPEPLRSQLLFGDMSIGKKDDAWQVIPTAWILAAEERWRDLGKPDLALRGAGVDPARGGDDEFSIAKLYGDYFEIVAHPGKAAPDGDAGADLVEAALGPERAPLYIDTIGVGGSVYDVLKKTHQCIAMNAGESAGDEKDKSGKYYFSNQRSLWWWRMREALDPNSGHQVALPPIRKLRQDLRAPRYKRRGGKIAVESKDDIRRRTGRSTDYGDAVVQVWAGLQRPGMTVIFS